MKGKPRQSVERVDREVRSVAQREANESARERGLPLPFPNIWDFLDPTKVPPDATPDEVHQSYVEFCKLCPPRKRRRHSL